MSESCTDVDPVVFVVDDDAKMLRIVAEVLGDEGFQNPLADIGGVLLSNQGDRDLAGPETG